VKIAISKFNNDNNNRLEVCILHLNETRFQEVLMKTLPKLSHSHTGWAKKPDSF